jgi:hypothetical protein
LQQWVFVHGAVEEVGAWNRLPISRPCMSTMHTSTVSISPLARLLFQFIKVSIAWHFFKFRP